MSKTTRTLVVLSIFALLLPAALLAGGGSTSHYETKGKGKIKFDQDTGQVSEISGDAKCDGTKIELAKEVVDVVGAVNAKAVTVRPGPQFSLGGVARGHLAIQIPVDATVGAVSTYQDGTMSTPLLVYGEAVVWSPNNNVAAQAEAFAGPPQFGFKWVGFRTNALLETVAGTFAQDLTWVFSFDNYPSPDVIGQHVVQVYLSDNAESPSPMVENHIVY